jgi:hypothetical protein
LSEIDIQPEDQAVFDRLSSDGRITHQLRRMITQQWNVCVSCYMPIPDKRPAFAGYSQDNQPLLVGACCSESLARLASPIYWTGGINLSISEEQSVWRYMDFAKFVAMLRQQGLYFTSAKNFSDPFEGAIGLANNQEKWDNHHLELFREAISIFPSGNPKVGKSKQELEEEAQRLLKDFKMSTPHVRNTLVSCWHENDDESEALWQLYCPLLGPGLAIKTTVGDLWDATSEAGRAIVGRVKYMDFRKSYASIQNERIFCKRRSLSHEREVRIAINNDSKEPIDGLELSCDLEKLIHEIVVSPFAPPWFLDVLTDTVEKFGYSFKLRPSSINEEPFY